MKYFIFSDIHGSATCCDKALNQYARLGCDIIICLGDILYHGPRNPIPEGYDNKAVSDMLNPFAEKIITCRGNCDCEVCEMMLDFPIMTDYNFIMDNGKKIIATHGHVISPAKTDGTPIVSGSKLPYPLGWDVFLYGHTHLPALYHDKKNRLICNPGSITLPKNGHDKSFAVYDNGHIILYNLDGSAIVGL